MLHLKFERNFVFYKKTIGRFYIIFPKLIMIDFTTCLKDKL